MGRTKRQQRGRLGVPRARPSAAQAASVVTVTPVAVPRQASPAATAEQPLPRVSLCTLTRNRQAFLPLLQACVASQTYPHHLIEWVIVDDSDNREPPFQPDSNLDVQVRHVNLPAPLILGRKRNVSHEYCGGEIIVYMDDDDYYPPRRVSHAVERLLQSGRLVAGATMLPIYFTDSGQVWLAGPYGANHATANTFAFRRELLTRTRYDDAATHAEEKAFLNDYQIPMAQLDPEQTILCMGHSGNTFDKRQLIQAGQNPRMRKLRDLPDAFIAMQTLADYGACHAGIRRAPVIRGTQPAGPAGEPQTISLDLGCGGKPRNPFQANRVCGIDVRPIGAKGVEVRAADLAIEPIPWADGHFDYITAFDFFQRVPRLIYCPSRRFAFVELMNEVWRCLKPGGQLLSHTPAYPHPEAFQDPAHVNVITEKTFTHYFAGPCWARTAGFRGLFEVGSQDWDGYALKTILVKRAVP